MSYLTNSTKKLYEANTRRKRILLVTKYIDRIWIQKFSTFQSGSDFEHWTLTFDCIWVDLHCLHIKGGCLINKHKMIDFFFFKKWNEIGPFFFSFITCLTVLKELFECRTKRKKSEGWTAVKRKPCWVNNPIK